MRFIHIAIAAALGAGAIWYVSQRDAAPPAAGPVAAPPPAHAAATVPGSLAAIAAAPARSAAAPASVKAGQRLEDDITFLAGTDRPVLALAAFQIIESCIQFQRYEAHTFDDKKHKQRELTDAERREKASYCQHMTETMKRDRLAYLDKAVKGGATGAAMAFVDAGPFGDPRALETRPDDPLVKEWKKQAADYLVQGAHGGDLTAMLCLSKEAELMESVGIPPLLRQAAEIAILRIVKTRHEDGVGPSSDENLPGLPGLNKEQLAAARAMADDLVTAYKARKEREDKAP
jgi:hypothetical protein